MDTLCEDLQGLIGGLETTREYSLLHYQDVNEFIDCYDWHKNLMIKKDWKWLLELVSCEYNLFKLYVYKHICIDEEILNFFAACDRFNYIKFSIFRDEYMAYTRMIASIIKGDVEYYRQNAISAMGYEYPVIRVLEQLHHALLFNQCQIMREFFNIWNHVDEQFLIKHFLTNERINILRESTTYDTIQCLWNVLVNKNLIKENNREFKKRLDSLTTRSVVREILNRTWVYFKD